MYQLYLVNVMVVAIENVCEGITGSLDRIHSMTMITGGAPERHDWWRSGIVSMNLLRRLSVVDRQKMVDKA